jgi:hypothetical protein
MTAFSAFRSATALAAGLLLLAACAAEPSTPASSSGVTTGGALPPPAAGENTSGGSLPVAPSAPLPSSSEEPASGSGEPIIVQGPDGTTWTANQKTSQEIYQADIEDCYSYAVAQTRRDARYIDDRNAGIDTLTNDSPYSGLRQRVDEYDLRNRRTGLMSSCMHSKGYARADTVLPRLEF